MKSRRTLLLSPLALLADPASAEKLQWVTAEVPPFVWQGPRGPEGYAHELFVRVHKQAGLAGELTFYPWARASRMLFGGQSQACLVVTRTADREHKLHWLFPIGSFRFAVFSRAEDGRLSADLAGLRGRRVAVLRGSAGGEMLAGAGITTDIEGKDYAELLALLRRGVVDAILAPDAVLRDQMERQKLPASSVHAAPLDQASRLFAAASPAMPESMRRRLSAAYGQLQDSGVIHQLRQRYRHSALDG
jgi:polar amino acid transport system substrate-binding protein